MREITFEMAKELDLIPKEWYSLSMCINLFKYVRYYGEWLKVV